MSQSCNQKKKSVGYCYLKEDASSVLNCNNFLHKLYFVGTANWGRGGRRKYSGDRRKKCNLIFKKNNVVQKNTDKEKLETRCVLSYLQLNILEHTYIRKK